LPDLPARAQIFNLKRYSPSSAFFKGTSCIIAAYTFEYRWQCFCIQTSSGPGATNNLVSERVAHSRFYLKRTGVLRSQS
jgi:hypothetical protein